MKKSILIIGAVILSGGLLALNYFQEDAAATEQSSSLKTSSIKFNDRLAGQMGIMNKVPFALDMGPRFRPITKSRLDTVLSFEEFLSPEELEMIVEVKQLELIIFEDEKFSDIRLQTKGMRFSEEQLKLMRKMAYSTNFTLRADYVKEGPIMGHRIIDYIAPCLSLVPEKQAEYLPGNGAFYEYVREGAGKVFDKTQGERLGAANLYFTVYPNGEIGELELKSSSNHPELDQKIIHLMEELPGEWEAAENAEGEKVAQQMVLSFGTFGC